MIIKARRKSVLVEAEQFFAINPTVLGIEVELIQGNYYIDIEEDGDVYNQRIINGCWLTRLNDRIEVVSEIDFYKNYEQFNVI